jgi:alpha-1,3-glucosyltransferase
LDYPPLFAWFEWVLAQLAQFFDKQMLVVSNLEYDSQATVVFQRLSVSVTGLVLAAAALHASKPEKDNGKGLALTFLIVANAGLIMVDNIHFQYNGILLGGCISMPKPLKSFRTDHT